MGRFVRQPAKFLAAAAVWAAVAALTWCALSGQEARRPKVRSAWSLIQVPNDARPPVRNSTETPPAPKTFTIPFGNPSSGKDAAKIPAVDPQTQPRQQIPGQLPRPEVHVQSDKGRVTLRVRDASVRDVLTVLAQTENLNIVISEDVSSLISISLNDTPLEDALEAIITVAGCTRTTHRNVVYVTSLSGASKHAPQTQNRVLRVFPLDFASAKELHPIVQGMLSAVGSVHALETLEIDNRRTSETLVVEDLAPYIARVEQYLAQVDQPPRQVLIEAHVLEVELEDDRSHGVDFNHLMHLAGNTVNLQMHGFSNPGAAPAFFLQLDGGNLTGLLDVLQTTADAKTLASPKVLVVNGQAARIQVGEQLGFRVTTVTQTTALESVQFLDVGVVLTVTPRISRDHHILMRVKPKVSTGEVNPQTGLPQEATTEVETDILLRNGQAMVIGGLIQEKDINVQSKLPLFGDLYLMGKLFQRQQIIKGRSEIIVVLVPHIAPYCDAYQQREDIEQLRAQTPLLHGPLHRHPRPWEPMLPDSVRNPRRWSDRERPSSVTTWRPAPGFIGALGADSLGEPTNIVEQTQPHTPNSDYPVHTKGNPRHAKKAPSSHFRLRNSHNPRVRR